ncbi:hypothetical protein NUW54_g10795 [Trametes sanguinea]|uniref:Uncharacterized protein n=1 Tax=Trametes sanguinea TaxID=158606 RepID=A0ACC1NT78_9APHY|nr:hypothetical protein NUW54_g10795 [Trametes sanguinea]
MVEWDKMRGAFKMFAGSSLKDDDLAGRVGLQLKELNKIMATLEGHKLVRIYRQNELKEGAQRSVGRQYFYIDYQSFCNVVKWRMAEMRRRIDQGLRNDFDSKGYICPQCHKPFQALEVDRLFNLATGTFNCDICNAEVIENENAENVIGSQDRMQRFNRQMRFILEGLRKTEGMMLPAFDVALWIKNHLAEQEGASAVPETPSRKRRATVVTRSPETKRKPPSLEIDVSPSKRREKSKSHSELVRPITPITKLEFELERLAQPTPTPRLSTVVDKSLFIATSPAHKAAEDLQEPPRSTPPRQKDDLTASPLHVEPYPARPARTTIALDTPAKRHLEGVYDRFLMSTTGVKRNGKGYQSDNVGPVGHVAAPARPHSSMAKRSQKFFHTARRSMPPMFTCEGGMSTAHARSGGQRCAPLGEEARGRRTVREELAEHEGVALPVPRHILSSTFYTTAMPTSTSPDEVDAPASPVSTPSWAPPRAPLPPHRLAKLANALGVATPVPAIHAISSPASSYAPSPILPNTAASSAFDFRRSPTPSVGSAHTYTPVTQTSKYLLHVIPPAHLPHESDNVYDNELLPPPPSASGYHAQFRRGILVPVYPTLQTQLAAIAKEYALPSQHASRQHE